MITFVTAFNNVATLKQNMLSSPCIQSGKYQVIIKQGGASASLTYNLCLNEAVNDYVVFLHQDTFLPTAWDYNLVTDIENIQKQNIKWGVIGCYGINFNRKGCGYVYSNGLGKVLGSDGTPEKALSVDEMVIVVNKKSLLTFDDCLPGYHFYGTDICLQSKTLGFENYVVKNYCIHNSLPVKKFDRSFWSACNYIRLKWKQQLPITTTCVHIHTNPLKYCYTKAKVNLYHLITKNNTRTIQRLKNPIAFCKPGCKGTPRDGN